MASAEDQEMVEAVGAYGPYPPLRVGVRIGRPHRRPDPPDALGVEDLVEAASPNFESRSWISSRNS
jgi:hypothetical protein